MKRTEVAKTMIDPETKARCEQLAALRGVPVSIIFAEAICAHVPKHDKRQSEREGTALYQRSQQPNVRSNLTQ